jgi:hypothetical protein
LTGVKSINKQDFVFFQINTKKSQQQLVDKDSAKNHNEGFELRGDE